MARSPDRQPLQLGAPQGLSAVGSTPLDRDQVWAVFGQVTGLVALTVGFLPRRIARGARRRAARGLRVR